MEEKNKESRQVLEKSWNFKSRLELLYLNAERDNQPSQAEHYKEAEEKVNFLQIRSIREKGNYRQACYDMLQIIEETYIEDPHYTSRTSLTSIEDTIKKIDELYKRYQIQLPTKEVLEEKGMNFQKILNELYTKAKEKGKEKEFRHYQKASEKISLLREKSEQTEKNSKYTHAYREMLEAIEREYINTPNSTREEILTSIENTVKEIEEGFYRNIQREEFEKKSRNFKAVLRFLYGKAETDQKKPKQEEYQEEDEQAKTVKELKKQLKAEVCKQAEEKISLLQERRHLTPIGAKGGYKQAYEEMLQMIGKTYIPDPNYESIQSLTSIKDTIKKIDELYEKYQMKIPSQKEEKGTER